MTTETKALRDTGTIEAELLLSLARKGVPAYSLNKAVMDEMAAEINRLWGARKVGESTEKIDAIQKELTAMRQEAGGL